MATIVSPKDGEKVLFNIRKNGFTRTKQIFRFVIFFFISVAFFALSKHEILTLVSIVFLLFTLCYAFYHFMIWYYDLYIITNLRLICVRQKSLFSKEFSEVSYAEIKDVTYAIKGVFATLFKFGTVFVKTPDTTLELSGLSYPDEVQEMIRDLVEKSKKSAPKEMTAQELIEMIAKSHHK